MNKEKSEKAVALFGEGYNCAQAVYMAFTDEMSVDEELAARIMGSFGGGMGRMRETCGAVTAMAAVFSMLPHATDPKDKETRNHNYDKVKAATEEFREKLFSINCADLKGVHRANCKDLVATAAKIVAETISKEQNNKK